MKLCSVVIASIGKRRAAGSGEKKKKKEKNNKWISYSNSSL